MSISFHVSRSHFRRAGMPLIGDLRSLRVAIFLGRLYDAIFDGQPLDAAYHCVDIASRAFRGRDTRGLPGSLMVDWAAAATCLDAVILASSISYIRFCRLPGLRVKKTRAIAAGDSACRHAARTRAASVDTIARAVITDEEMGSDLASAPTGNETPICRVGSRRCARQTMRRLDYVADLGRPSPKIATSAGAAGR